MVEQELRINPKNCLLIDFDENFPMKDDNVDGDARNKEIFDLLVRLQNRESPENLTDLGGILLLKHA